MKLFKQDSNERFIEEITLFDVIRNELNRISGAEINYNEGWIVIEQEVEKATISVTFLFHNDELKEIQVHSAPIKKETIYEEQKRLL